jgi:hypothetical protein
MKAFRFVISAGTMLGAALLFATLGHATVITCNAPDDGLTYSDVCPSPGTSGRCVDLGSVLNGCCNKGTCSGSTCNTGPTQDAYCLEDGNTCTDDTCSKNGTHQAVCAHDPKDAGEECDLDGNVCTLDTCNGSSTCVAGPLDTCAEEQSNNPAEQPICKPWKCDPSEGCKKTAVPNDPVLACNDGKDCTTGDHCVNGSCVNSGTIAPDGYPCRDDDTSLGNGDNRTWCQAGTCDGETEGCNDIQNLADGAPCDPNPCTNAFCDGEGADGDCIIASCNTGQTVDCQPCAATFECLNYQAGQNANVVNPCGCRSLF